MAAKYLTIVGQLQWLVTLGRHVAAMSRFRVAPRQGHMDRLKGSMPMLLVTCFIKNLCYVLVVLNLSILEIIGICNSMMTSSGEPQCHCDIIRRTSRIMGKPGFPVLVVQKHPYLKYPFFELGIKHCSRYIRPKQYHTL